VKPDLLDVIYVGSIILWAVAGWAIVDTAINL